MRITFVFHTIGKYGGAEKVVASLCNQFASMGHDVTLVTLNPAKEAIFEMDPRVVLRHAQTKTRLPLWKTVARFFRLKKAVKESAPDIMISFLTFVNITSTLIARLLRVPIVISERSDPHRSAENAAARIFRPIVYPLASGYVFQTEQARQFFSKRIQKKATIISNPVLCSVPAQDALTRKDIVVVGRMIPVKNQQLAVQAFSDFSKTCPGYRLHFLGNGPLEEELKRLAQELGVEQSVVFHGFQKDVVEQIKGAGMFLLTSNAEGMPNALMEAMVLGIPCISTDCPCGGPASLIEQGKSGFLVPKNDREQLAACMRRIAQDEALAQSMAQAAAEGMQRYSLENIANEWITYLKKILAR